MNKLSISKNTRISITDAAWFVALLMYYSLSNTFRLNHYAATLLIFSMTVLSKNSKLNLGKKYRGIMIFFSLFSAWMILSFIWSSGFTEGQKTIIISLIEIIIMLVCMIDYIRDKDKLVQLILIFVYATFTFEIIYYLFSPVNTWGTTQMGIRLAVWRNAAGYYFSFAAIFALYVYYAIKKEKKLFIMGILLIIGAVGTGSRKVFVQLALAVLIFIILQKDLGKKIKFACGIILFFILAIGIGIQIPAIQELYAGRLLTVLGGINSTDASTVTRALMRRYALELFAQHPIIGAGLDQFRVWIGYNTNFLEDFAITATYSHCNYTELLANNGIIGFLLYYLFPVKKIWKRRKKIDQPIMKLGMITTVVFIILDYGTISYYMRFYAFIFFIGLIALDTQEKT